MGLPAQGARYIGFPFLVLMIAKEELHALRQTPGTCFVIFPGVVPVS